MRVERLALTVLAAVALVGCGAQSTRVVPTYHVDPGEFTMRIHAFGELQAANSTPIETSRRLRGQQRIAWIAQDGQPVEEGDVVCRLDADGMLQRRQRIDDQIAKIELQLEMKRQDARKQQEELDARLALLRQERDDAAAVQPRDEALFSRQEIIDAQVDLDLIETRLAHTEREAARAVETAKAEVQILELQRSQKQSDLDEILEGLAGLEIRAPHAGVFLRGKTWQGEKMRVGMSLWSGQSLGELPDVRDLEAKVWVLETEAAGLAEGLEARVTMDGSPSFTVDAEVRSIQPIANPIDKGSPVKYFEVVMGLATTDTTAMKPGGQVRTVIEVDTADDVITVPNQALFGKDGKSWLYVRDGDDFEQREVTTGRRSVSRTVIDDGLSRGDEVALIDPTGEESS